MTALWSPRAQCDGKRKYASKPEAKHAARRYETYWGGGHVDVYRCPHCASYHIGHPRFKKAPK